MFTRVLVGLKEGLPHDRLLELAASAAAPGGSLRLVTMVRVGTNDDESQRLERTKEYLEAKAAAMQAVGFDTSTETGLVTHGASFDLLRAAEQWSADLIVLGLAKRTRVGKALMGSDAQRVMMGAQCPVLVTQLYRD